MVQGRYLMRKGGDILMTPKYVVRSRDKVLVCFCRTLREARQVATVYTLSHQGKKYSIYKLIKQ